MPRIVAPIRSRLVAVPVILAVCALGVFGAAQSASASVQAPVGLGGADSYEVLGASTVTNTGVTTINNGDVGLSPGTSVTGFPPAVITNGVIHATDAQSQRAEIDVTTGYNDAAGRASDGAITADLAGQVFTPGVYTGGALALNGIVTLDGTATDVFIFQASSTLITGSGSSVVFTGGANSCNVYWQVASSATIGSNSAFAGTVLSRTSITANTNATIDGRLLALTGAVTLDSNVINRPTGCGPRSAIEASTPTADQIAAAAATQAAVDAAATQAAADAAAAKAAADLAAAQAAAAAAAVPTATPTATRTPRPTATRTVQPADDAGSGGDDNTTTTVYLARTGFDVAPFAAVAGGLVLGGVALMTIGRMRRRSQDAR